MSLYREPGRLQRRRRLLAAAGAGGVALVVAAVLLAGAGSEPRTTADKRSDVRAAARTAADGLELLLIEYGQAVRAGRVVAQTEYAAARADVQRAQHALRQVQADARSLAPAPARAVDAALQRVAAAVGRRAAGREVRAAVEAARGALRRLTQAR